MSEHHSEQQPEPSTRRKRPVRATLRQRQVLQLVLAGLGNKDIARQLGISGNTAREHVSVLLKKYQVKNRAQLMALHVRPIRGSRVIHSYT